jgi:hypothetical protein
MVKNTAKTFNGSSIYTSNYRATILNAGRLPAAQAMLVEQVNADSDLAGSYTVDSRYITVSILILDYANRDIHEATLKNIFLRGTRGNLVTTFKDDGLDYYLDCMVLDFYQDPDYPTRYIAYLQSTQTAWRAVNVDTLSDWNVSLTGGTTTFNNAGLADTRLCLTLRQTAAPTVGYLYQNIYRLPNIVNINYGSIWYCITMDTATLIAGLKMQSSCNDLRIILNGESVPRWIANPNSASTKVWFKLNINGGYNLKLGAAITNTNALPGNIIQFAVDANHQKYIAAMPNTGVIYHGTEWMAYKGKNPTKCQLTITTRGVFGTTQQTHAVNDVFVFIQNVVQVKYGNSAVGDPSTLDVNYDADKPPFDLSASDNSKWVFTTSTKFTDVFKSFDTTNGDMSHPYSITQDAESGNPALGSTFSTFLRSGVYQAVNGAVGWVFNYAGGLSKISATGQKYRNSGRWPITVALQRSSDGITYYNIQNEATPDAAGAWSAIAAISSLSLPAGTKYIRSVISGQFPGGANYYAMYELLTVTAEFTTYPSGAFLGETSNGTLDLTITNTTTGDAMIFDYAMILNKDFVFDGENYTVQFDSLDIADALRLDDMGRSIWIRLKPGNNSITLTSPDTGTLKVSPSYYRRRL